MRPAWSALVVLIFSVAQCAWGAISANGDVSPLYPATNPDPWDVGTELLQVGDFANGALTIDAGSQVISSAATVASSSNVEGTVNVAGAESSWTNSGDLLLGISGMGTLSVLDGGTVFNFDAALGRAGGVGEILVEGAGSELLNAGEMFIGDGGSGLLTIREQGHVVAGAAQIGRGAAATGSVVVADAGASWSVFGALVLGDVADNGSATLSLTGMGSRVYVGTSAAADGDLLPANETALIVSEVFGAVHFEIYGGNQVHNSGNAYVALGEDKIGTVIVDGATSAWNNAGNVSVGSGGEGLLSLVAGGTVSAGGLITIGEHGTLTGDGTAIGDTFNSGLAAPGHSIGDLIVTGDYTQAASGKLAMELSGTTTGQFDTLAVTGQAMLNGTLEVEFGMNGTDTFVPTLGDSFEILTAENVSGQFANLLLPALTEGLAWKVMYGNSSATLMVESSSLPGDYNDDGLVDAADYTVWRDTLGSTSDLRADGDDSGDITALDYEIWKDNFGAESGAGTVPTHAATVPEPETAMLAWGLLSLLAMRGREQRFETPA